MLDNKNEFFDPNDFLLDKRILFLNGEIDDGMADDICKELLYLDLQSSDAPIMMYINSPGGSFVAGLAIYDIMRSIRSEIITIGIGQICSMAVPIFLAGTYRHSHNNAEFMIHQPSGGIHGNTQEISEYSSQLEDCKRRYIDLIVKYTKKKRTQIEKDMQKDHWMTAEEAVKYGIVEFIIKGRK